MSFERKVGAREWLARNIGIYWEDKLVRDNHWRERYAHTEDSCVSIRESNVAGVYNFL